MLNILERMLCYKKHQHKGYMNLNVMTLEAVKVIIIKETEDMILFLEFL